MTDTRVEGINAAPQSGGRGTPGYVDPRRFDISEDEKKQPLKNYGNELVDGFNANSPGQYDMFIEDIPYTETRHYTKRVLTTYFMYKKLYENKIKLLKMLG